VRLTSSASARHVGHRVAAAGWHGYNEAGMAGHLNLVDQLYDHAPDAGGSAGAANTDIL
jgi:hypothetical protein